MSEPHRIQHPMATEHTDEERQRLFQEAQDRNFVSIPRTVEEWEALPDRQFTDPPPPPTEQETDHA